MTDPGPYLIWSHEHQAWWAPNREGYVRKLSEAGRYSREDALTICTAAIPGTAYRLGALPELPVRMADMLVIGAAYDASGESWEREPWA